MENWPELRSWARGVLRWVSVALSQSAVRVAWQDGLRCSVLAGALGGLPARAGALGGGVVPGWGSGSPGEGALCEDRWGDLVVVGPEGQLVGPARGAKGQVAPCLKLG